MTDVVEASRASEALPRTQSAERIVIVDTAAGLAALEANWAGLWREAHGLVFQSHAWVAAWWATAPDQDRRSLRIATAWRGDDLVAVLPLAIVRRRGFRVLEWAAKDHTDYADAIIAPGYDHGVVARLWDVVANAAGFDLVYLNRLLPDATARRLHDHVPASGSRLSWNHRSEASLRVVGTWPDGKAWFDGQSKKTRQNYRRGVKFIEEQGALTFRLLGADEPLQPILERLAALKRQWLAAHQLSSALFDEGAPALLALVQVLADHGVLHAFVLESEGKVIAVSINIVQNQTMMAFVTTYDPSFERGSPGMVLMMDYIQWSLNRGIKTIDFLCGAEPFKSRFATESVSLESLMGWRSMRGALAVFADRANQRLRRLRARPAEGRAEAGSD